ncbi:bifunctional DNA primase/polymerase [Streptosporangium sp. NPDC020145]|uniref:bifunctional DNA primase/polymerase n=1 Tax=Streptosporangium sp. NPDC020145 TaxID=3154694 RepID=UPI003446730A
MTSTTNATGPNHQILHDQEITVNNDQAITDYTHPFKFAHGLYREAGWQGIIRLPHLAKKHPPRGFTGYNGQWPSEQQLAQWADGDGGKGNIGLRLPRNVVGIDVDQYVKEGRQKRGAEQLAALVEKYGPLPPTWSSTRREPDGPSRIYLFRVPEGTELENKPGDDIEAIQFHHRYAVVWPSMARDDSNPEDYWQYAWYAPDGNPSERVPRPEELAELPEAWVKGLSGRSGRRGSSRLAQKVALPRDDSGRGNDWLTSIAGSLAKEIRSYDTYIELVRATDRGSDAPQDPQIVDSIANRIWEKEQAKAELSGEDTGWLRSGPNQNCIMSTKSDQQWSDFDIRVQGVIEIEVNRQYCVIIRRKRDSASFSALLSAATVASNQALTKWLANFGCTIAAPYTDAEQLKGMPNHIRLMRYLESQGAPPARVTPFLGWDNKSDAFLTHTGLILGVPGETDVSPFKGVRPDPAIRENDWVSCHYGFEADEATARQVLGEVMHFHFPQFTAVMGSFMVASVLKGQLDRLADVWPYPIIEAPSGASKSNGFMPMIQQLMGRKGRSSVFSEAAMKSALGAHRCLPEWIDDPNDVEKLKEILRLCSSKGGATKKGGADWKKNEKTVFVTTPIVSAESLNILDQKAYIDRAIPLSPEKPSKRISRHGDYPQIDDIKDLEIRYEDELSCLAGHVVSMILQRRHLVTPTLFRKFKAGHSGRHADKLAILQVGAMVLADILGEGFEWIREEVEAWVNAQVYNEGDNRFTRTILRQYIAQNELHEKPTYLDRWQVYAPVLLAKDVNGEEALWVNIQNLAIWWDKSNHGRIEKRTDTEDAMKGQARQLGMKSKSSANPEIGKDVDWLWPNVYKVEGGRPITSRTKILYQRVPDGITEALLSENTP